MFQGGKFMKKTKLLFTIMITLFVGVGLLGCSSSVDSESGGDSQESDGDTDYPTKAVNLINPYAAGGPNDIVARAVSSVADEVFDQPIVTVTKEGAGGAI